MPWPRSAASSAPRLPPMLVTADHSDAAQREAEEAEMTLLRKPVRPAELRSLLSFLLSQA